MKQDNILGRLSPVVYIGYPVTAVIFLLVPLIMVRAESRSPYFWPRLLWAQFLVFLVWGVVGWAMAVSSGKDRRISGGLAPFLAMLAVGYGLLSFSFMIIQAMLPSVDFLNRIHLAMQIILAGVTIVVGYAAYHFITRAESRNHGHRSLETPPADLVARLQYQIERLNQACADKHVSPELKALRDTVMTLKDRLNYSLPQLIPIDLPAGYSNFALAVESVCDNLSNIDYAKSDNVEKYIKLKETVEDLIPKIRLLASGLRK